jgi:hypothetical protein
MGLLGRVWTAVVPGHRGTYAGWSENGWAVGIQSRLNPGQYAEVSYASTSQGAWIDQYYWTGNWNQFWYFSAT